MSEVKAKSMPRLHELKTWPVFFREVRNGNKNFEIRNNDRNFQEDDILVLREYDPNEDKYSGWQLRMKVTYLMTSAGGIGLQDGYCIMGIAPAEDPLKPWLKGLMYFHDSGNNWATSGGGSFDDHPGAPDSVALGRKDRLLNEAADAFERYEKDHLEEAEDTSQDATYRVDHYHKAAVNKVMAARCRSAAVV